jgi:hypothetical protein
VRLDRTLGDSKAQINWSLGIPRLLNDLSVRILRLMLSLSQLTAALGTASNQQTFGLASLNLDFSLFEVDAPPEYVPLGTQLSKHRRSEAEGSSLHKTTRGLAALFDSLIEPTPKLIKAYGQHVSQISESPAARSAHATRDGIFSRQAGADGTSIRAAATSGHKAVSVNLLACLLARIWPVPEATAVWVEIVAARKQEIHYSCDGTRITDFAKLVAAQTEVTSRDLQDWDTIARAWLSIADDTRKVENTQLRLILENINMPVNTISETYESVLRAWKVAMITAEKLLNG